MTDLSPMRQAVEDTLTALQADGLLHPRHAALCQLARELADVVAAGADAGAASGRATAARQLRDTLLALPQPEKLDAVESFTQFVADMKARDDE